VLHRNIFLFTDYTDDAKEFHSTRIGSLEDVYLLGPGRCLSPFVLFGRSAPQRNHAWQSERGWMHCNGEHGAINTRREPLLERIGIIGIVIAIGFWPPLLSFVVFVACLAVGCFGTPGQGELCTVSAPRSMDGTVGFHVGRHGYERYIRYHST